MGGVVPDSKTPKLFSRKTSQRTFGDWIFLRCILTWFQICVFRIRQSTGEGSEIPITLIFQ